MTSFLTVIYGPPRAGKSTLARALANVMPGKTAVVSVDQLLGAITVPDLDAEPELAMVHTQLRLLVANYLKNGYHVVVEGPFVYERGGRLHNAEAEIDQLIALMRNLVAKALIVRLDASELTLRERSEGREADVAAALRIAGAYKGRYGDRFQTFDSGTTPLEAIVKSLSDYFQAQSSPSRLRPPTVQ